MSKNKDLIQILIIIIIGMFIPFLGSLSITYGLNLSNLNDMLKIGSAFGYFLIFFAIELIAVMLYYKITSNIANKKLDKYKQK